MPTDASLGWDCVDAPSDYDDMVTSMRIARTESIGRAYGHWVGYTGTEQVSF